MYSCESSIINMACSIISWMFISICTLLLDVYVVRGETISDVDKLMKDKLSPDVYNIHIRGQKDLSMVMTVKLQFDLQYVLKLDELQETIQVLGLLSTEWMDERLVWDLSEYNNTEKIFVPADRVWRPEIVVANPSSTIKLLGKDISRLLTEHHYSGQARWTVADVFDSRCSVDSTAFPWDVQNCTIWFVTWAYHQNEIRLAESEINREFTKIDSNGEWEVLSTRPYVTTDHLKSFFAFEIVVKRQAAFFVVNIMIPIITLSVLNLVVFIVPVESGERVTFSLTVLLSIGVFLTLVSGSLPPNAETMAAVCYLLVSILVQSTITCLLNIISLKVYFKHDVTPEPDGHILTCLQSPFTTCSNGCSKKSDKYTMDEPGNNDGIEFEDGKERFQSSGSEGEPETWKNISKMLDYVFLATMTVVLLFSYAVFIYHL